MPEPGNSLLSEGNFLELLFRIELEIRTLQEDEETFKDKIEKLKALHYVIRIFCTDLYETNFD
jgi:hypothetical protein